MTSSATIAFAIMLAAASLWTGPTFAQANGDPGSALLGISRAEKNTEMREKSNENTAAQQRSANPPAPDAPANDGRKAIANGDHHD